MCWKLWWKYTYKKREKKRGEREKIRVSVPEGFVDPYAGWSVGQSISIGREEGDGVWSFGSGGFMSGCLLRRRASWVRSLSRSMRWRSLLIAGVTTGDVSRSSSAPFLTFLGCGLVSKAFSLRSSRRVFPRNWSWIAPNLMCWGRGAWFFELESVCLCFVCLCV